MTIDLEYGIDATKIEQTAGTIRMGITMLIQAARDISNGNKIIKSVKSYSPEERKAVQQIKQLQKKYQKILDIEKRKCIADQITVLIQKYHISNLNETPNLWCFIRQSINEAHKKSACVWLNDNTGKSRISFKTCVRLCNIQMYFSTKAIIPADCMKKAILTEPQKMVNLLSAIRKAVNNPFCDAEVAELNFLSSEDLYKIEEDRKSDIEIDITTDIETSDPDLFLDAVGVKPFSFLTSFPGLNEVMTEV